MTKPKKKIVEEETLAPLTSHASHMSCVEIRIIEKLTLMEKELQDLRLNQAYMDGKLDTILGILQEVEYEEDSEEDEEVTEEETEEEN